MASHYYVFFHVSSFFLGAEKINMATIRKHTFTNPDLQAIWDFIHTGKQKES